MYLNHDDFELLSCMSLEGCVKFFDESFSPMVDLLPTSFYKNLSNTISRYIFKLEQVNQRYSASSCIATEKQKNLLGRPSFVYNHPALEQRETVRRTKSYQSTRAFFFPRNNPHSSGSHGITHETISARLGVGEVDGSQGGGRG